MPATPMQDDARAVTTRVDAAAGVVHATVEIDAAPERVFHAFTTPAELAAWWGSPDTYRTEQWTVDLRPGGRWHCHAVSNVDGQGSTVGASICWSTRRGCSSTRGSRAGRSSTARRSASS